MKIVLLIGCWLLGALCVLIMKKIEPHNKYPIWALFISIMFTLFAFYDLLGRS
jgi:hypothetical protein